MTTQKQTAGSNFSDNKKNNQNQKNAPAGSRSNQGSNEPKKGDYSKR